MRATPSSSVDRRPPLPWVLLRHEWRLTMRDFFRTGARRRKKTPASVRPVGGDGRRLAWLVFAIVALHAAGATTLALPRHWQDTPIARLGALTAIAFLSTWMLSYTMSRIVAAFHERRDLDLMLGAPVDPSLILAVRALSVVAATTLTFAFFLYPFVDVGVVAGRWWLARVYPLVPLMALVATAVALLLTDAVVRLVGVRRARVGLQVFSALIGASMYFVTQARQFLPPETTSRMTAWLIALARADDAPAPVAFVAALARGDLAAWSVLVVAALASFAGATWWARGRFVEIARTPEGATPLFSRSARAAVTRIDRRVDRRVGRGFARGVFMTLLAKEWRLVLRAPQLVSQVLLQILYLTPLIFVAIRRGGSDASPPLAWGPEALVAGLVGIASTLATSLAWLTVAAEDAPDLVAGCPQPRGAILGAKLVAAVLPPLAILAIAAIAMGTNPAGRPVSQAAIVFVFGALACTSAAIVAAASPGGGKRSDFQQRHRGRGFSAIVEGLQFLLWAAAAGTATAGAWIAALPLTALALVFPAIRLPRALRQFDD